MKKFKLGRSILATLLASSMVLANCVMPVAAEADPITYVSLGDSMSNGYCFEGYEQGEDGIDFLAGEGVYGDAAYPNLFEARLEELYGAPVNHIKLAPSAMRAEDLNFLLGGREEAIDGWENQVNGYTREDDATLSEFYQNSIESADIITMGIGNASFGAYMLHRVTDALGVFGASLDEDEKVDLEDALSILDPEQTEAIIELYEKLIAEILNKIPADMAEEFNVQDVCNIVAYTAAGFVVNYKGVLDQIIALNPDVEIVLVGLMNTTYGMTITSPIAEPIAIGDIMDEVFAILNAYIAGLPTVMQGMGEWQDAKFYYAEQPNPLFISQQFAALKENGWGNIDGLSGQTVRERNITAYNDSLVELIGPAMELGALPEITLAYVDALDGVDAANNWTDAGAALYPILSSEGKDLTRISDYVLSTAIYLAIEDAVAESTDTMEIPLEALLTIVEDIGSVFTGLDPEAMGVTPNTVRGMLGSYLTSTDILKGMCKIYALFKVGNGMSVHPTPEGHRAIYEAVEKAYIEGHTAKDETIKNITDLVKEYYDEAYAYAYAQADANGYVDAAVVAIDNAINVIKTLNFEDVEMTDEFRAELAAELAAVVVTLEEVKAVLAEDKASDVNGLYNAVIALQDDLYTHLANAGAILAQAGNDVNDLAVPVVEAYVKNVIVPVIDAYVKAAIEAYFDIADITEEAVEKTTHKKYVADDDSYYVALGGRTVYGKEAFPKEPYFNLVASELGIKNVKGLGEKEPLLPSEVFAYVNENAAEIANADLITYQTDASSFIWSLESEDPNWNKYIDPEIQILISDIITKTTEVLETNWNEYANAKVEEIIADVKGSIMESVSEYDVADDIVEAVVEGAVKFAVPYISDAIKFVADKKDAAYAPIKALDEKVVTFAGNLAYAVVAYAIDTVKAIEAIQAINPEAVVYVVGMYNPLNGLQIITEDGPIDAGEIFEYVIEATNLYYAGYAAVNGNIAFVDVSDAETDGFEEAINVTSEDISFSDFRDIDGMMHANADGHITIAEKIVAATKCVYDDDLYEAIDEKCHAPKCDICGELDLAKTEAHDFGEGTVCTKCGYEKEVVSTPEPTFEPTGTPSYIGGGSAVSRYTVKFDTNGGSAVANVSVKKGEVLTKPADPTKEGFVFDGWYTDKELTAAYDFSQPVTKSFTLYAKWADGVTKFTDLDKDAWYYDYVKTIVAKGLMNGISETEFAPNMTLTRGMFVTILHRVENEAKAEGELVFTDVAADAYYAEAIKWANANGIVKGVSETEFAPDADVTREQMAAMIARYVDFKGIEVTAEGEVVYTDSDAISDYAKEAVVTAKHLGLLIGNDDGSFAPQRNTTRAEAAALFVRLLGVIEK